MDINLYNYVGKEVYATLQNGEVLYGTVQLKFPSETGIDTNASFCSELYNQTPS